MRRMSRERKPVEGFVSSVSPLATRAGLEMLDSGGNAVDAAVAVALALGVVDGHNSGIGGGCFLVIRLADGSVECIDGREMAPAAATPEMFIRNGEADTDLSQDGALASGVPGALAAYHRAASTHGKLPWADHFAPGIRLAKEGFPLDGTYARKLARTAEELAEFPASKAQFLKADGSPYKEGETLKLPDLARSYEMIAENGPDWFYKDSFPALAGRVDERERRDNASERFQRIQSRDPRSRCARRIAATRWWDSRLPARAGYMSDRC